jgi:molecular chaperone HtpG
VIEYTGLLFVPSTKPFDLFDPTRKHRVNLYVKRVFITDDCEELLPPYLRFLRGVIDTEDLPLNISRELLQHNPMIAKIRNAVVKRVLGELKKKAQKVPDDYAAFWDNFGAVLKEGLYEDSGQREALLGLARFRSTVGDGLVSLADYLGRMKEGQEAIFYITGDELDSLAKSPQIEGFAAKDIEVLLLTDPVDEFWLPAVGAFEGKPFKSVTRGGADLGKIKAAEDTAADGEDQEEAAGLGALLAFVKLTLKDEVKDVRGSERLTESAVCLVADEGDLDIHLERILKQHGQLDKAAHRILEVNPKHSLIRRLAERVGESGAGEDMEVAARLLLDQARILEGEPLADPAGFARRLSEMMARGLAH